MFQGQVRSFNGWLSMPIIWKIEHVKLKVILIGWAKTMILLALATFNRIEGLLCLKHHCHHRHQLSHKEIGHNQYSIGVFRMFMEKTMLLAKSFQLTMEIHHRLQVMELLTTEEMTNVNKEWIKSLWIWMVSMATQVSSPSIPPNCVDIESMTADSG